MYQVYVLAYGLGDPSTPTKIDYGRYNDKFEAMRAVVSAMSLDANDYWTKIVEIGITLTD